MRSGSGSSPWPDANLRTAGVKSGPKSFDVTDVEHGNAANPARFATGQTLSRRAGRVRGRSIGRTKEAKASGNALDMPTLVWSEMARKQVEPPVSPEKQMTASTCWLMRPGAPVQERRPPWLPASIAKPFGANHQCRAAGRSEKNHKGPIL
jgi:hypothetical protein